MRRINVFLYEKQIAFLVGLSGTISEHIRRAIDEYIQNLKALNASASQSKRKEDNG